MNAHQGGNQKYLKLSLRDVKIHNPILAKGINTWEGNAIKIFWSPTLKERFQDFKHGFKHERKVLYDASKNTTHKKTKFEKQAKKLGIKTKI